MNVAPGAIIDGRYRVERKLGAGGVGEVWAGVRIEDGVTVAIKTLLPAASAHHELVTRFKREADFLARIRSMYVARVLDFLSDKAYGLVLVLEYVEGEPLNEILRRTSLSVEDAIDICWDVVGGIADLHRSQIIHRDLKPGNIIVQKPAGGKSHAVIVDFGMSRLAGLDHDGEEITALTRADIAVGTMEYMAPEQILNSSGVTPSADIYALGAMLYRAVAGRHVFGDLTDALLARHKLINDPPPLVTGRTDPTARGFEAIVMRMIQRAPQNRYQRAEDLFAELTALRSGHAPAALVGSSPQASSPETAAALGGSSPHAAPSIQSTTYDAKEPPRRRWGFVFGLGACAFTIAALGALFVWKRQYVTDTLNKIAGTAHEEAPPPPALARSAPPEASVQPELDPEPAQSAPLVSASAAAPTKPARPRENERPVVRASAAESAKPKPAPSASGAPKPLQVDDNN